ncbi:MAG: acyl-CoA thioesterase [Alphaproteobacteria bacterium]|jgi:acyl-CoA thioester hydrolase|nr:acyl-CoA thioesterase [Alphaproteobacteria bacterium]
MSAGGQFSRSDFKWFIDLQSRWMDNDAYGHINNVIYYAWFDTAVNRFLVDNELLDYQNDTVHGIVIESKCTYLKEFTYPDVAQAGLKLQRLGNTSVAYDIGLFHVGDDDAAALGYLVHVYVDTQTRQPVRVPDTVRAGIEALA